jgi:hypothetical protein
MLRLYLAIIAFSFLATYACSSDQSSGGGQSSGASCPAPKNGPTNHGADVTANETWTADGSPHTIPFDMTIRASATLTLEPCAVVQIAPSKTVTLNGALHADGTAAKPIQIGSTIAGAPFSTIRTLAGGKMRLVYVTITNGGAPLNTSLVLAGALQIRGDQTIPTQEILDAQHLTISGSASQGLYLFEGGGFSASSTDVIVTGSASYPMHIWGRVVGTVPPGNYTGNAIDEILLAGSALAEAIVDDATMHDRGVPYHVGGGTFAGDLRVGTNPAQPVATLTIEPGVTIRFAKNAVFEIEHFAGTTAASGALIAAGTAAKPIVFTSAETGPAAGDWLGIYFGSTPNAADKLDHVRVEYAGGASASGSNACNSPGLNDGAIRLFGDGAPATAFLTNSTISNSAGHGVDRGWRNDSKPDFLPTNTFTGIAKCEQSYPKDTNGGCATTAPCP